MRQLGLIFVVFGLNGFLNFLSTGPMPTGLAGQFMGALFVSHYYYVVAGLQVIGGAIAGEPICAARVSYSWTSNREHNFVSPVFESSGHSLGNRLSNLVVHCFLRSSPILLW